MIDGMFDGAGTTSPASQTRDQVCLATMELSPFLKDVWGRSDAIPFGMMCGRKPSTYLMNDE
jgi:hypothetical protein